MFNYYGFILWDRANHITICSNPVPQIKPPKDINVVQRSAYHKPVRYTSGGPP